MKRTVTATDINGELHEVNVDDLRWRPAAYGIVIKDDRVLLLPAFGGYSLPGGGLELGETIQDALVRELKEETGIAAQPGELLGVEGSFYILPGKPDKSNFVQSLLLYYRCDYVSGEPTTKYMQDDEAEYGSLAEWMPLSELDSLKVITSVDWRPYVRQAANR